MLVVTSVSAGGLLVFINIKPDMRWKCHNDHNKTIHLEITKKLSQRNDDKEMETKKLWQRNYHKEMTNKWWWQGGQPLPQLGDRPLLHPARLPDQDVCQEPSSQVKTVKNFPLSHLSFTRNPISSQGICSEDGVADIGRKLGDDRSLPVVEKESKSHPKSGSRKLKHNLSGEKIAPKIYI